jgi:5'-nucleotidase
MTYLLATNDDGIHAPGLLALVRAACTLGDVRVIAPNRNQSSSGHKKTLYQDITLAHTTLADGRAALAVGGSPADCVALAALGALGQGGWPPRLVISGINRGANMGQDITYSGTVTAALEATIQAVPALAFSLDRRDADAPQDYAEAAAAAATLIAQVLARPLPPFTILNVNFPAHGPYHGIRLTRQGIRIYRDAPIINDAGDVWQIGGETPIGNIEEQGTDMWAVHHGYVSVTPIHLDMTAHRVFAELSAWDLRL